MATGRMDIAIVGAACRLPGGISSPDQLWSKLRAGENLISEIPADRWNKDLFRHDRPGELGRSYTFRAGVIDNAAAFDASFFGIPPPAKPSKWTLSNVFSWKRLGRLSSALDGRQMASRGLIAPCMWACPALTTQTSGWATLPAAMRIS